MKKSLFSFLTLTLLGSSFLFGRPTTPYVEGYWESWNPLDKAEEIASMPVKVIDIAFGHFVPRKERSFKLVTLLATEEKLKGFIEKAHSLGKEVKISIFEGSFPFACQLKSQEDAEKMAFAIARYVRRYNLDGVDFFMHECTPANLQIALIEHTRARVGPNANITFTAKALSAVPSPCDAIIKRVYPLLSAITVPAYNMGCGFRVQSTVHRLQAMGVPSHEIVIGLMPGKDEFGKETNLFDIEEAAKYVKAKNLGGIALWSLNRDHQDLTGLGKDQASASISEIFE